MKQAPLAVAPVWSEKTSSCPHPGRRERGLRSFLARTPDDVASGRARCGDAKQIRKHPELQEVPQENDLTAGNRLRGGGKTRLASGTKEPIAGRDSSYSCENRPGRCAPSRGALDSVRSRSWLRRSCWAPGPPHSSPLGGWPPRWVSTNCGSRG